MALSFENVPKEDREMFRASTARKREAWKRDTELERLLYSTASAVATTRDEFEDAVRAAGAMAAMPPPLSYGQPSQMFQQGNFNNAAAGGQDGAGQTTKAPIAKRKTICINCSAHDHVSYNPACTNYHIHLQQLAAKAESLRKAAAAHGGIDRTVALRDGSGEI